MLVTSAGASVGEHDLVKDVLEELDMRTAFWRVRVRPGSPFSFGRVGDVPVFGLPGNPVSALVTCELFVKPAIRRALGRSALYSATVRVRLAERVTTKGTLTHFLRVLRGILLKGNGLPEIAPELWPIGLFLLVAALIALARYRETLD